MCKTMFFVKTMNTWVTHTLWQRQTSPLPRACTLAFLYANSSIQKENTEGLFIHRRETAVYTSLMDWCRGTSLKRSWRCGLWASEGLGADFTSTTRMLKPAIVSKVVADSNYTWDGGLMWIDSDIGGKLQCFVFFSPPKRSNLNCLLLCTKMP